MSQNIEWSPKYMLGVTEMDEQHKELISRVNLLITAQSKEENKEQIETLIEFLRVYVVEHFGSEERLQRQYQYPHYETHRKEHFEFVKFVGEVAHKYINTHSCEDSESCVHLLQQLNDHLLNWITIHIAESDKKVADHILRVLEPNHVNSNHTE